MFLKVHASLLSAMCKMMVMTIVAMVTNQRRLCPMLVERVSRHRPIFSASFASWKFFFAIENPMAQKNVKMYRKKSWEKNDNVATDASKLQQEVRNDKRVSNAVNVTRNVRHCNTKRIPQPRSPNNASASVDPFGFSQYKGNMQGPLAATAEIPNESVSHTRQTPSCVPVEGQSSQTTLHLQSPFVQSRIAKRKRVSGAKNVARNVRQYPSQSNLPDKPSASVESLTVSQCDGQHVQRNQTTATQQRRQRRKRVSSNQENISTLSVNAAPSSDQGVPRTSHRRR